jgi:hypothetical protein
LTRYFPYGFARDHHSDHALILTDREITEFIRLSTGKQSQVFEQVSMVRGRLHRGLLFTKTGRSSFAPSSSSSFERDEKGTVMRRAAKKGSPSAA